MMSPSRAGSSHSSSWTIFGSWPFLFSSKKKFHLENWNIDIFSLFPSIFVFFDESYFFFLKQLIFVQEKKFGAKKLYMYYKKLPINFRMKFSILVHSARAASVISLQTQITIVSWRDIYPLNIVLLEAGG